MSFEFKQRSKLTSLFIFSSASRLRETSIIKIKKKGFHAYDRLFDRLLDFQFLMQRKRLLPFDRRRSVPPLAILTAVRWPPTSLLELNETANTSQRKIR